MMLSLLLAQAVANPPIDWQSWFQFGLGAVIALYLIVYDGPRQRDKYEASINSQQVRYEASIKEIVAEFRGVLREERESRKEEMRLLRESWQNRGVITA